MAARINRKHNDEVRARIQTSQLINRLQAFILDEVDPSTGKPTLMTSDQVRAALGLLKKTMPDLQSIDSAIDVPTMTHEQWLDLIENRAGTGDDRWRGTLHTPSDFPPASAPMPC